MFFGKRPNESNQGEKEKGRITSSGNSKQLKIWYNNCDVLTISKLHELSSLTLIKNLDIACLSEVTSKNFQRTLTLSEYSIFGYNMEPPKILNQNGRRMLLYLKKSSYQMMNESTHALSPQELTICQVKSEEGSIILDFRYRSPNSSNDNSEDFNITLKCPSDNYFPSNLLVIDDFNYPKIEWE